MSIYKTVKITGFTNGLQADKETSSLVICQGESLFFIEGFIMWGHLSLVWDSKLL